jgi:hypothetical protein
MLPTAAASVRIFFIRTSPWRTKLVNSGHRGDLLVFDADVAHGIEVRLRIDDAAPSDYEIIVCH